MQEYTTCHTVTGSAEQQDCLVFVQNSVCVNHTNHVRAAEYLASQNGKCLKNQALPAYQAAMAVKSTKIIC